MITLSIPEAEKRMEELIDRVLGGEDVLIRKGRKLYRLVPADAFNSTPDTPAKRRR